jgi:hypothetical protein
MTASAAHMALVWAGGSAALGQLKHPRTRENLRENLRQRTRTREDFRTQSTLQRAHPPPVPPSPTQAHLGRRAALLPPGQWGLAARFCRQAAYRADVRASHAPASHSPLRPRSLPRNARVRGRCCPDHRSPTFDLAFALCQVAHPRSPRLSLAPAVRPRRHAAARLRAQSGL